MSDSLFEGFDGDLANLLKKADAIVPDSGPASKRGAEAVVLSMLLIAHVEGYTVKQYGDYPEDIGSTYTIDYCITQIKKLAERHGKGQRGRENELRDLLKIAHYAAMALSMELCGSQETFMEMLDAYDMRTAV